MAQVSKSNRGFASMDPDKRREIARKGGKASGNSRKAALQRTRSGSG